jgi:hypothetical protein
MSKQEFSRKSKLLQEFLGEIYFTRAQSSLFQSVENVKKEGNLKPVYG